MMYDLTNLTNSSGLGEVMMFSNEVTGGMFISMTLVAVFFILFVMQKKYDTIDALLSSAFVCFVLAVLLAFAGMVSFWLVVAFLTLLAFGVLYKHFVAA